MLDALGHTLYRFESLLKGHQQKLVKTSQVKSFLESIPQDGQINLLKEFEVFLQALKTFDRHVRRVQRNGVRRYTTTKFADLESPQAQQLTVINSRLNEIEAAINQRLKAIDDSIDAESTTGTPPLCDREYSVKVQCVLRKCDPAFREDSDNYLADYEIGPVKDDTHTLKLYWPKMGWPEGYEFDGMAHDEFMHQMRYYGAHEMGAVDLQDMLRIGNVDLDVVVYYQFSYDLDKGVWLEGWGEEEVTAAPL